MDLEATDVAAELDGGLHTEGSPLSARDTLVASPVLENAATLVTWDRDFESVPGLDGIVYDE